jgi:uncharacterized membrane protein YGL010W
MRTLVDHLANYAAYHRDRRNIATHLVGVPMIVVAVTTFLSRPAFDVSGVTVSPATLVAAAAVLFYLRLDARFGMVMTAMMALSVVASASLAAQSTSVWLGAGVGLFVAGWIIQFVGHYWEGRKPAFLDDILGLLVGPLFVVAEVGFAMGLRAEVQRAIEERVGPTRVGRPAATVTA